MKLDLEQLKKSAQAADQGVWCIGQSLIETNGGYIECLRDGGEDSHDENMQFIGQASPDVVLELVKRLEAAEQRAGEIEKRYDRVTLALAEKQTRMERAEAAPAPTMRWHEIAEGIIMDARDPAKGGDAGERAVNLLGTLILNVPDGAPPLSRSQTAPHITWTDHDRFLFEAACECMSPDQVTAFERAIADDDLRRRFANCMRKRFSQDVARMAKPSLYFYGDHEHGFECPDDAAIVSGRKLGDRYTLNAAWYAEVQFEVTRVPDDTSDDYEVREVSAPQPPQAGARGATGTFACPICGRATPHEHSAEEQIAHRNMRKKIPDWHEGTLMEILGKAGLRFQYRNEDVRSAVIAGIKWGFDRGMESAAPAAPAVAPEGQCAHDWTWADGKCADCGEIVQKKTATTGMTLGERISHVGGWINAAGHVEFGSPMAVDALIRHALRDAAPAPAEPKGEQHEGERCNACHGSGWVVRDPDIGTDQECFVCDGTGTVEPEQRAATLSDEPRPSLTSPLTPYGLLVRALRIVAGTTLYDMSKALLTTPAKLSAMDFGRAPVTQEFAFDVSAYFDSLGVPDTLAALNAALLSTLNGGTNAD
jgi:hypothetical protein